VDCPDAEMRSSGGTHVQAVSEPCQIDAAAGAGVAARAHEGALTIASINMTVGAPPRVRATLKS
jgi:hypothetical protein